MEALPKLQQLLKSGRYECDQYFYTSLFKIVEQLNLYSYMPLIQKNKVIVERIAELTKKHLVALEQQDNEEKALQIIHQINKQVSEIDTSFVSHVFKDIEIMGGKGYEDRLISFVKSQTYKKMYLEILDRIINNLHDPKLRVDDMLVVGVFMAKNADKAHNFIAIYANVIENGVNQLKKFRQNYEFIKHNPEVEAHPKVTNYLKGSACMITCLLKFYEIYKLLSGDTKFGLKLNVLKKDIQFSQLIKKQSQEEGRSRPVDLFKKFLVTGQPLPNICSLCLCLGQDHIQCKNTIKLLYHQQMEGQAKITN